MLCYELHLNRQTIVNALNKKMRETELVSLRRRVRERDTHLSYVKRSVKRLKRKKGQLRNRTTATPKIRVLITQCGPQHNRLIKLRGVVGIPEMPLTVL